MQQATSITYETRLILFVDFLGFREIVEQTSTSPGKLEQLVKAIDNLKELGGGGGLESRVMTQFSDSLVISYDLTERSAVFHLLVDIALTIVELVGRGYLVRGAVTFGRLYHTSEHLVGPAMVRAYEMESKEAIYPRVLVDPELIRFARRHRSRIHSGDDEEEYVRHFLTLDEDGRQFVDYVSWEAVVEAAGCDGDRYPDYLRQIGKLVGTGLTHPDKGVLRKYLWLHKRYVAAITTIAETPPDSGYRQENPGVCETVAAYPRYSDLAEAARSRIAAIKP